jgi:hypothetical protein
MRLDKRDHKPLALWATACAEHVLLNFEESYPMDNLPRKALEATRAWVRGEVAVRGARRRDRPCWYSRCACCQLRCDSRDRRSRPHRLSRCHRQGT